MVLLGRATQQSRGTRKTTKHRTITESYNGSNNQQRINSNRTTALRRTAAKATGEGGGFNAFNWHQIPALDSAVVETQKMLSSHEGFLAIVMYHHRETI